jgi:hypothetical protein
MPQTLHPKRSPFLTPFVETFAVLRAGFFTVFFTAMDDSFFIGWKKIERLRKENIIVR